ncbi:MAG: type VI secretion system tip protein TssI/VgrG [Sulfitobacter sp.]
MPSEIKSAMTINGKADPPGFRMIAALISGAINDVPGAYLEFVARNKKLDLSTLVGSEMGFWVEDEDSKRQPFWGTCISAEAKGTFAGEGAYIAEIRPWLWFLTRSRNNRIYQNKKTTDIIKDILGEYGFSGDLKVKHGGTDPEREYCVQYRETDLDFIKRLLEEEGFYFYFEHGDNAVSMILTDQPSTHAPSSQASTFVFSDPGTGGGREKIATWESVEKAVTGKVTLRDYDFTKPSSDLTATSELQSGSHSHKSYESYEYPGRYKDVSDGEKRANALIEEEASGHQVWSGTGNMFNLNVGKLFEVSGHPRHEKSADNGFMVTKVTQFVDVAGSTIPGGSRIKGDPSVWVNLGKNMQDMFKESVPPAGGDAPAQAAKEGFWGNVQTWFDAVLKSKPYRGPKKTPRPEISGVQTAVVTGPAGEEIAVDEYGRIKVQFHWDRDGKKDDKTSCWVRTMMPWTGKNWGTVALPRIGQEVVIQFEEGDPDRPLCTGMLYNAETMPPYDLPANATRSGTKTNSSKGGGGYNELMLEDKKGDELVRFMAEKDYVQNVQNAAHVKVGYPHGADVKKAEAQDAKSMKVEVQNHLDEIVETGDHSFEVQAGKQTIKIKKDKTETIEGKSTLTITEDKTTTVKTGNVKKTVDQGNDTTTVTMGNISIKASAGKIDMEAMQSITLKVGANSVKIDQSGVTITGMMVKIDGKSMLDAKAPMIQANGSAMLILKGGLVLVN